MTEHAVGPGAKADGQQLHVLMIPSFYPSVLEPTVGSFFRTQALVLKQSGVRMGMCVVQRQGLSRLVKRHGAWTRTVAWRDEDGFPALVSQGWHPAPGLHQVNHTLMVREAVRLVDRYCRVHGTPDLIHAQCALPAGDIALAVRRETGIPFVLSEHSTLYARGLYLPWQRERIRKVCKAAAWRTAVSPQLCDLLRVQLPDCGPWDWVPNVLDPLFEDVSLHHCRNQPGKEFAFLNVGYLTEKKAQELLIRAFASVVDSTGADMLLRIGGDGPLAEHLSSIASECGVADRVRLLGVLSREAVLQEMLQADCFVLSSTVETFGVVLIEAGACGLPCVATRSGGPECVITAETGLLVPTGDVDELARGMLQIYRTTRDYDAGKVRSACVARFGADAFVQRMVNGYGETLIMSGRHGRDGQSSRSS